MQAHSWILAAGLLMLGCQPKDQPVTINNPALGLKVTFPGAPKQITYLEPTSMGPILWYNLTYQASWELSAAHLHVDVGSPKADPLKPRGSAALLAGFQEHLRQRLGALALSPLPLSRGPGFSYVTGTSNDRTLEGVVILRRGQLYHAQGARFKPQDPALTAFLDGFSVAPLTTGP